VAKRTKSKSYHHGDLRRAMIEASLRLIADGGVHALSLREAARVAGASSGAPYRHFADKEALLRAIADEGRALLQAETDKELQACEGTAPALEFRARGLAFVLFAAKHPVHFQLMYSRDLRALEGNGETLCSEDELKALLNRDPNLRATAASVTLAGQCLAYGLARMIVDGELPGVPTDQASLRAFALSVLNVLGAGISHDLR
jgi:AcrR family transcriptional regulator